MLVKNLMMLPNSKVKPLGSHFHCVFIILLFYIQTQGKNYSYVFALSSYCSIHHYKRVG